MLLGVDVGGTFTDAVLLRDGHLITAKAPSTPADQSEGVMAAIAAALDRAGAKPADIRSFSHGMTVATNALLEGRGARTVFLATEGFTDVIALGRQDRASLYDLCAAHPPPLTPPERRLGVPERMGPDGPVRALEPAAAAELAGRVAAAEPEAVAVTLLHAYRHPEHERQLAEALAAELADDVHISLSHAVVGTFREYERAATTEIDAALSPLLAGYLRRLRRRCAEAGVPTPDIMQSAGGLIDLETAATHAAWTVLSGPAGGATGAALIARSTDTAGALCFDMGGTSCDVSVIEGGQVQEQGAVTIAGRPLALPAVAVHTVGAGGGSIAWRDGGGALRVGPRSAGAEPGPACYARGGREPTVTDANLLLGYLAADTPLAGGIVLDAGRAERAIAALADSLEMDTIACAEGIVRVAGAEMTRALRVVSVERGIDPRGYALLAFGGAGGLHATQIADELGIERILVPQASGVLAALGLVASPRRRDAQRSVFLTGERLTDEAVAQLVGELGEQARRELSAPDAALRATFELRYRGQAFELPVAAGLRPAREELAEAFGAAHEERYGYRDDEQALELVTIRVTATTPGPEVKLRGDGSTRTHRGRREARLGGRAVAIEVLGGAPAPGTDLDGPAVLELSDSTVLVPAPWSAHVDPQGTIVLTRSRAARPDRAEKAAT